MHSRTSSQSKPIVPQTMRAVQQTGYGKPGEVLTISPNVPTIQPCADEILVQVYAASINPIDTAILAGNLKLVVPLKMPYTPGCDVAGVIVAVGNGCSRLKIGDAVYGDISYDRSGAMAEYCVAKESSFDLKPSNLSFVEAAALPLTALTAYQVLFKKAEISAGEKIFITAGSSAVGMCAIQLAKSMGCYVAASTSSGHFELLRSLGCDYLIDHENQNWGQELKGQEFDLVFDTIGGKEQWENSKLIVKQNSKFITIVGDDREQRVTLGNIAIGGANYLSRKVSSYFGQHENYMYHITAVEWTDLQTLRTEFIESNKLKPIIDRTYQFEQVTEMFEDCASRHTSGKLVLNIVEENRTQQTTGTA